MNMEAQLNELNQRVMQLSQMLGQTREREAALEARLNSVEGNRITGCTSNSTVSEITK